MASKPKPPIFLERRSYRKRRLMDAVRLLPVVGALLWMVPLIWPVVGEGDVPPQQLSNAAVYVFGVWVLLIVLSAFLRRAIKAPDAGVSSDEGQG